MNQSEVKEWDFIKDFKTEDGSFSLYDRGIGFRSPMINKNIEYFSFCKGDKPFKEVQGGYIGIKNDFIDYKVVIFNNKEVFILFLYPENLIKPIKITGNFCGDISSDKIKTDQFHFISGHSIISNGKIETIKDFGTKINNYKLKNFTR